MEGGRGLDRRVPARLTHREGRRFAFTVGVAFLVLGGIVLWRGGTSFAEAFFGVGGALILAGVVIPNRLGGVYRAWMGLAHIISRVTTPIFMGFVYYVGITPLGLVLRAIGRNPIRHDAEDGSLWQVRPPGSRRSDLTRQF
jgi:hypothetical protein